MNEQRSTVAILAPCYNEREYIGKCLDSLLSNDYPAELLDVVVIDGMSDDGTREVVAEYASKHPHIRLLDNPARLKPHGLNLGIRETDSEVVMRVDTHATYAADYVSRLVSDLDEYEADNTGGVRETHLADEPVHRAIGVTISHPFAAANAHWRTGTDRVRAVDTVFGGCYRRSVFERIGLFNEHLIRTQDREFNRRLTDVGGVIVLDPAARCLYYPRKRLADHWRWTYDGAMWLFYARRFTDAPMISWRNMVPMAFVAWHVAAVVALGLWPLIGMLLCGPVALYWCVNLAVSAKTAVGQKQSLGFLLALSVCFAITHYGYGLGSWIGAVRAAVGGKYT